MTPLIREMVGYTPDAERLMWFDIGHMPREAVFNVTANGTYSLLPFPRIVICGITADGEKFMLAAFFGGGSVAVSGTVFEKGRGIDLGSFAYMDTDEGLRLMPPRKGDPTPDRRQCAPLLCIIRRLQDQLSQGAIDAHQPVPRRGLINDKRRRKGKKPLFDWHTVTIEPPTPKAEPQGGHHASPRKHDRRGHWRTYRSGKKAWVKNCVVGNAALGVVFKDYEVAA